VLVFDRKEMLAAMEDILLRLPLVMRLPCGGTLPHELPPLTIKGQAANHKPDV
jgi:hypothetical protein